MHKKILEEARTTKVSVVRQFAFWYILYLSLHSCCMERERENPNFFFVSASSVEVHPAPVGKEDVQTLPWSCI